MADVVISTEVAEEPTEEVVAVEEVVTEETEAAEPEPLHWSEVLLRRI